MRGCGPCRSSPRADPGRPAGRHRLSGGGGRLLGRRQSRLHPGHGGRGGAVGAGPQARQGHLGTGRPGPHPVEAAGALDWQGPGKPGRWRRIQRRFGDGHTETWWAADARLGGFGPDRRRLVVATTDPARLPGHSSWYLLTNLGRPASRRAQQADLAEVVGLYGLGNWVEQGYKQVTGELGWADFQVRSARAIRRHWTLVAGAFSFGWRAWVADHPGQPAGPDLPAVLTAARGQRRPDIGAEPAVRSSWPVAVRWRCGPG
jgi:hypothetical protein